MQGVEMKQMMQSLLVSVVTALALMGCSSDEFADADVDGDCRDICTWQTECVEQAEQEFGTDSDEAAVGPFGSADFDACMQLCVEPNQAVAQNAPQCYDETRKFYICLGEIECTGLWEEDDIIAEQCGAERDNSQAVCEDAISES